MSDTFDNLHPLRRKLSARAELIKSRIEFADEIKPVLDRPYLVKGWLDRGAVSVCYGAANTGKSFWAIDLAHHVFMGERWAGHRVAQGNVLYIAAEGGALFANRLAARKARFAVLRGNAVLAGRQSEAGPLAEALESMAGVNGDYHLIVVDTLSRVMGGGDENTAPDVAALMHGIDQLADRTGAHVMLIHHSGKDAGKGARGHSSLRAAVDTEIELTADGERRIARATKQRDMAGGAEMAFTLKQVELGRDSDGDPVTTCIVEHEGGQPHQSSLI